MRSQNNMAYHSSKTVQTIALYDRVFLFAAVAIIAMGLLMVASSSMVIADRLYQQPFYYLYRQLLFLGIGLGLILVLLRIDTDYLYKIRNALLLTTFFLLILVYIPGLGKTVNGSTRWINLIFFRMQVSELAKFCFVIYLAGYMARHQEALLDSSSAFWKPILLVGGVALLLLLQPDFGAAVVILITTMGLLFLSGVKWWRFAILVAMALLVVGLVSLSAPYRIQRMTTFLNPWASQYGSGYQLTQSLIAFGRGGWFGVGLGESVQKLFYLPEAHTDFLFAVLAEEMGLLGVLVMMSLYALLIVRGFKIAKTAIVSANFFSGYMAYGMTLLLSIQCLINLGVNAGALPTKGLTLPLMSSGGSSLLVCCMMLGIILRIDHENRLDAFCLQRATKV